MYEGQKQNFKSNVWKAFTQVHDPKLSSHCLQEMSWIFAFELVGRDFLNLDRPCSRHCLCPEHRPLLSCSRHCEQVNVILSFANFEEFLLNQGPENNNSETTGRRARGCCWNPHQVRHKTGERQLKSGGPDALMLLLSSVRIRNCSRICSGWPVWGSWYCSVEGES